MIHVQMRKNYCIAQYGIVHTNNKVSGLDIDTLKGKLFSLPQSQQYGINQYSTRDVTT